MPDANEGVTSDRFVVKTFEEVLAESLRRATAAFGNGVDLAEGSALLKLLQVAAAEDFELWKGLERLFNASFLGTATGEALTLLGDDLGEGRRTVVSGFLRLRLKEPTPGGGGVVVPAGALVTPRDFPSRIFLTLRPAPLPPTADAVADVPVRSVAEGRAGDIPPGAAWELRAPDLAQRVQVSNPEALVGGEEPDDVFRHRLLQIPRATWTIETVAQAVRAVEGVKDVLVVDSFGGLDVDSSLFATFRFGQRAFQAGRSLGEPSSFKVFVAHQPFPWESAPGVLGVAERVRAAVDRVRPVGVLPEIFPAKHTNIGIRARVRVAGGFAFDAVRRALLRQIEAELASLKLGGDVLSSRVMRSILNVAGVVDVQDLHLRRGAPVFDQVTFGAIRFLHDHAEETVGANLRMTATEIAVFDSEDPLNQVEELT